MRQCRQAENSEDRIDLVTRAGVQDIDRAPVWVASGEGRPYRKRQSCEVWARRHDRKADSRMPRSSPACGCRAREHLRRKFPRLCTWHRESGELLRISASRNGWSSSNSRPRAVYEPPSIRRSFGTRPTRSGTQRAATPSVTVDIECRARVPVREQDLNCRGQIEATDRRLTVCCHHEIDQPNGIFWIHRLCRSKPARLIEWYEIPRAS